MLRPQLGGIGICQPGRKNIPRKKGRRHRLVPTGALVENCPINPAILAPASGLCPIPTTEIDGMAFSPPSMRQPAQSVAHELDGVKSLNIAIRAGFQTGECEVVGDKREGVAFIGARVGALAEPGEVLVSGTVKDLVVGSASFPSRVSPENGACSPQSSFARPVGAPPTKLSTTGRALSQ